MRKMVNFEREQRIFHAGILKSIEDNLHERFDFQGIQIDEKTLMTRVDFYEKKNKQIMDKILGMMKDIETDIKDRQNKIDALRAEEDKIYKANQLRKQVHLRSNGLIITRINSCEPLNFKKPVEVSY